MRKAISFAGLLLAACVTLMSLSSIVPAATAATASHDTSVAAFTQTETISRSFLSGGQETVADTRTVTLNVSQTSDLQGRQEIGVSWSGAHPTGDIVPDPNSAAGEYEEYPFVLLECRGTASG
ncbi:MAG: hypothetical protein WAL61_14375, partial [Acidimicrobiales bacterium]